MYFESCSSSMREIALAFPVAVSVRLWVILHLSLSHVLVHLGRIIQSLFSGARVELTSKPSSSLDCFPVDICLRNCSLKNSCSNRDNIDLWHAGNSDRCGYKFSSTFHNIPATVSNPNGDGPVRGRPRGASTTPRTRTLDAQRRHVGGSWPRTATQV